MLASETVTSHQDGPLNQIPDKAASKPGAGLASHKSERATMEAFPKIRNQCSVAVNIECKKEKYKNKGKKTWPKLLPIKSPVGSWAVNQKTLKKKKKKKKKKKRRRRRQEPSCCWDGPTFS